MCRILIFLSLFTTMAFASAQQAERILSFDSDIVVQLDSSLSVVETIRVRANGNQIKRGIYRDFPTLYSSKWGLQRERGFEVKRVLRDGNPENYVVENIGGGKRVRIGNGHVILKPGVYTYQIEYRTTRQLGYKEDFDELYWNVTGNGWAFPIEKATATIRLPGGTRAIELNAYTGTAGSKGQRYRSETLPKGAVKFETTSPLSSGEGLTISVTWPKGAIDYKADPQGVGSLLKDNIGAAVGIFGLIGLFLYFFLTWKRVGVDPPAGTIIPLYSPPAGFSPAAVRNLYRMKFDDKAFSAAVIGLASKGLLKIRESGKTYQLEKLKGTADLTPDEQSVYQQLFRSSRVLSLKQKNHKTIGGAKTRLKNSLAKKLEKTHFVKNLRYWLIGLVVAVVPLAISVMLKNPEGLFILIWVTGWSAGTMMLVSAAITAWRGGNGAIGATLFAIPFVIGWCIGVGAFVAMVSPVIAIIFALTSIMVVMFYHLLKAPTHYGREILDQIEGFKQYLSVAEADRLNLINPPARTPELFEKFLPYALALDVDQEWSEQFTDVLATAGQSPGSAGGTRYSPSFYSGNSNLNQMAVGALTSAIAGSLTSALASSSVSPSSSSGSGGGGSSGGGGGGGGGGGW